MEKNESGTWTTKIKAKKDEDDNWRDIEDVIQDFDESKHEIIRGNVVNSTRYLQNRVKQFLSKIVLNKENPMSIYLYSYKAEFQLRGAGRTSFLQKNLELEYFMKICKIRSRIDLRSYFFVNLQILLNILIVLVNLLS